MLLRSNCADTGNGIGNAESAVRLPLPLPVSSVLLSLAGLAVSAYLAYEHYTSSTTLACPETGIINCQKVTNSDQSQFLGIPVVLLGLLFFAGMLAVSLPVAWRIRHPLIRYGRLVGALGGVGFVGYLVYAELFILDSICMWCTAVHAITLILFAVIVFGTAVVAGQAERRT